MSPSLVHHQRNGLERHLLVASHQQRAALPPFLFLYHHYSPFLGACLLAFHDNVRFLLEHNPWQSSSESQHRTFRQSRRHSRHQVPEYDPKCPRILVRKLPNHPIPYTRKMVHPWRIRKTDSNSLVVRIEHSGLLAPESFPWRHLVQGSI